MKGSKHLSELIVPADHTAHAHPLAVQEIRRILRLDIKERNAAGAPAPAAARGSKSK